METTEIIGAVVVGLTAIVGLFLYIINSFSKYISEPYKKLTEAIEKLNLSITLLNANDEATKVILSEHKHLIKEHDRMIADLYNRFANFEFNCAFQHNNPLRKDWRELSREMGIEITD